MLKKSLDHARMLRNLLANPPLAIFLILSPTPAWSFRVLSFSIYLLLRLRSAELMKMRAIVLALGTTLAAERLSEYGF